MFKLATSRINAIDASEAPKNTVRITATTAFSPVLTNIQNLLIGAGADVTAGVIEYDDEIYQRSSIKGSITVEAGATLDLNKMMTKPENKLTLTGDISGTGTIKIPAGESSVTAAQVDGVTFEIQNTTARDQVIADHQYINPPGATYRLTSLNPENDITYENGQAVLKSEPQPDKVATLLVVDVDHPDSEANPLVSLLAPYTEPFTAEAYYPQIVDDLKNNPAYVLMTGPDHAPQVNNGDNAPSIRWTAKKVAHLIFPGDTKVRFTVTTTDQGQTVSYTIDEGPADATKKYQINGQDVELGTAVTLEPGQYFTDITVTEVDAPKPKPTQTVLKVVDVQGPAHEFFHVDLPSYTEPFTPADHFKHLLEKLNAQGSEHNQLYYDRGTQCA